MPVGPAETSGADIEDTPDQVLLMRRDRWPHATGLTDLLSIHNFDTRQRRISFTCRGSRLSAIDRPDDVAIRLRHRSVQAGLRPRPPHIWAVAPLRLRESGTPPLRFSGVDRFATLYIDGFQFAGRAARGELRGGAVHYIDLELA